MKSNLTKIINQDVINCVETKPKKCKGLNVLTSYRLNVFQRHAAFTLAVSQGGQSNACPPFLLVGLVKPTYNIFVGLKPDLLLTGVTR